MKKELRLRKQEEEDAVSEARCLETEGTYRAPMDHPKNPGSKVQFRCCTHPAANAFTEGDACRKPGGGIQGLGAVCEVSSCNQCASGTRGYTADTDFGRSFGCLGVQGMKFSPARPPTA